MQLLTDNLVIKELSRSPIVYRLSCKDFELPISSGSEKGEESMWTNFGGFVIAQWDAGYAINCVAASGTYVATADLHTNEGWNEAEAAINSAMACLRGTVMAIRDARTLPPLAPDIDALLTRAIALRGITDNIPEWAQRLSDDVSELTD